MGALRVNFQPIERDDAPADGFRVDDDMEAMAGFVAKSGKFSLHVAPLLQGTEAHSSMSDSHWAPVKPSRQAHSKKPPKAPCEQVPRLAHGLEAHSLMSLSQWVPVKPPLQVHE
jgi:hypothetical protein